MKHFNCILLIDDDDASNFITREVINDIGLADHTHSVHNGIAALNFLDEHCANKQVVTTTTAICPDIILLDINMPKMDGFEFLETFFSNGRFAEKDIRIVVLTSSVNPRDMERASKYAIHGYIDKPLTEEKLQILAEQI